MTDENGEFTLVVTDPSNKLYIQHRGYVTQEWPINRTMYKVHMFDSMKDFEDVYYYPSDGSIDVHHRGSFRTSPPCWLHEYSFNNEEIKIDWDEFFQKFDLFLVKYI